jgi:hypothetical protein
MSSPEDVQVLRVSGTKAILFMVLSLVFVAIGVCLLVQVSVNPLVAWVAIVFFGLRAVVFLIQLIPGASYLRLTPEGLTMCAMWRKRFYRWDDIAKFGVTSFQTGLTKKKMVGFNFASSSTHPDRSSALVKMNVVISGYEAGLPDDYRLGYQGLADLLNARLQQARSRAAAT